ncbi:MAG: type II secretion system protein [Sulfurisoma sp.]|nr:type II secretion system protein [Sulfurisoma sp.]
MRLIGSSARSPLDTAIRLTKKSALAGRRGFACRGFTMIELIVTMVLIGILAVFVSGRLDFKHLRAACRS